MNPLSIAGWLGTALFLLAYALMSVGKLSGQGTLYRVANLVASTLVLVAAVHNGLWSVVALQTVLILITLWAMALSWNFREVAKQTSGVVHCAPGKCTAACLATRGCTTVRRTCMRCGSAWEAALGSVEPEFCLRCPKEPLARIEVKS